MVSYYEIPVSKYAAEWADCVKILKTSSFKLSHHFPPRELRHFLPTLNEKTRYDDFEQAGSTTDYELFS
jgi:hypothetical protein